MNIEAIKPSDTVIEVSLKSKADTTASTNAAQGQTVTQSDESASVGDISAAVQAINAHLLAQQTEPQMSVDYLSGLDVVSFKSQSTGDVLFQVPSVDAVRLARLIGEGASLSSLGLMDEQA